MLMDKRKIDPIWEQIEFIQSFPVDFNGLLDPVKNFDAPPAVKKNNFITFQFDVNKNTSE